ncbi:MAG: RNA methyltransferase [Candidatus Cloacimonas sp. SDB]|nr:MAG: RNA methyltransferase [Candidatus Cloacimonas sp. SDB]
MFEYQKTGRFFAQVAGKMEELAAAELQEFGVKEITPIYRGIWFTTDLEHIYRINYRSRLISRVLAPLLSFNCHSTKYLYETAVKIDWEVLLKKEQTFAIFANISNSKIKHSKYAALVLKDAIADHFAKLYGERPSVDRVEPDLWINLHIENDKATISADTSGGPLHRRGYRVKSVAAPMQETLAAAIIRLSEWQGEKQLWDPMCGSGTLLCEALMLYCRIPAANERIRFGFQYLPDYNSQTWHKIEKDSIRLTRDLPPDLIYGSDINSHSVSSTRQNLNTFSSGKNVKVDEIDFRNHSGMKDTVIVTNPPYGVRLGEEEKLKELYRQFGDFLKNKCQGSTAYIYCGNRELIGSIGLKPSFRIPLVNGDLDGRLIKIEVY